jgi:hypothetical protein
MVDEGVGKLGKMRRKLYLSFLTWKKVGEAQLKV